LGEITKRAEYIDFAGEWRGLSDENAVRRCLLRRDDRVQIVYTGEKAAGKTISEINFNSGCNIAMIRRNGSFVVPHGNTEIKKQDELILIGHEEAVKQMKAYFEG
jgi:Trk K+ transport system NAD-binding subunit